MKKEDKKDITRATIYIERELYKQLKIIAIKKDEKINECINKLIKKFIEKNKKHL